MQKLSNTILKLNLFNMLLVNSLINTKIIYFSISHFLNLKFLNIDSWFTSPVFNNFDFIRIAISMIINIPRAIMFYSLEYFINDCAFKSEIPISFTSPSVN